MEVMISLGVLVVGLVGTVQTANVASKISRTAGRQVASLHAARAGLETLRLYSYTDPEVSDGSHAIVTLNTKGSYDVSTIAPSLKCVIVNVPWTNALTGKSVTTSVTTVFSQALH